MAWVHPSSNGSYSLVPNTVIESAVAEGAVCLDGSPPAYNWLAGKGPGAKNWLVYLQGAGWCLNSSIYHTSDDSVQSCESRATGEVGSSHHMQPMKFKNVFSVHANDSYFFNWNRVIVRYCDGGSFAGDADKLDPVTKLYYRGGRIFNVVVKELMAKGMSGAQNVLLAGGSSGGLGVMIHCDRFRGQFSKSVRVKCLADGSLFLHMKDRSRAKFFETVFSTVVGVHHLQKALPKQCASKMSATACFFPQNLLDFVESPIFILNSAFDSFQITNTFGEGLHDQIKNHMAVSEGDMALLKDFREQIIHALPPKSAKVGYVVTSLFAHSVASQIGYKKPIFPAVPESKSIESAVLDWFYDRAHVHLVDPTDEPFVT
ncbi:unnamed protein product [Cuscuta epithymum]|uniref:Pectin acetylesterase n=1 Tax=Cuscuta epithymum TaxID=186058 RepID=A0AAV0G550_9ASTE|nr:unnamed protein product [Cuscuta epithymum]